ncbi:MAG: ABC transporter substrate-binding protein, partial [Gaiellaceae bacterium]
MPTVVRRRPAAALLLSAAVLAASACGEREEPLGALEQRYPVTVQGAGDRPAVATARPERIVALDSGSAELVLALGARDRLVGVPAGITRGDGPLQAPPSATEVVSRTQQMRMDEIRRLEPDLIVAAPATDLLDVSRAQRQTGAVAYVQPASSVDDVVRAALELGFLVGEPVAARRVAADIRSRVAAVEERVTSEPVASA